VSRKGADAKSLQLRRDVIAYLADGGQLAVIKAPPGSGKTHLLIEVLAGLVEDGQRVAVAAQTNSQADDICRRIAKTHRRVRTVRFASKAHVRSPDIPSRVEWVTATSDLPNTASVTVSTTAKWSLTDVSDPFDLFAVDEAWQMSWADLMQCALISSAYLLIGDPGQIAPIVTIDVRRWETSPRAPHVAAPQVVLNDPGLDGQRFDGSLPACRRLPSVGVQFVRPFYDFSFDAYAAAGSRGVDMPRGHSFSALADGLPLVLTVQTPAEGPPVEVDHDLARQAARVVEELLRRRSQVRDGQGSARRLIARDIGVTSTHRVMNAAISAEMAGAHAEVRVDTPERWQGLERPVMIALHPLSGVADPSPFDLDTGRLCVMASRHQAALILLTRDHIGETLADYVPSADQAPGRPDIVGRGHDAHSRFWDGLRAADRMLEIA